MNTVITRELISILKGRYALDWGGIHGAGHWARVRNNGLALAKHTGANVVVVELFAFLHDSCRHSDGRDSQHGHRAAQLVEEIGGRLYRLGDAELDLLWTACDGHTNTEYHDDPTIGTCWDADRLDLPRVGIMPDPNRLCTEAGRMRGLAIYEQHDNAAPYTSGGGADCPL